MTDSSNATHLTAATTGAAEEAISLIPLDDIHESPFNPRKLFGDMDGLATDIRAHGRVLQPLLVRPRTTPLFGSDDGHLGFELVFGHRRHRAAGMAELTHVHCMVKAMSDAEARRAQVSENLQRKDVHPIEEAEGFQQLMTNDGMSADAIAQQFGKSRSYVYGRLKLLEACPAVRNACLDGEIGSEVALLIARIAGGAGVQEKALASLKSNGHRIEDGGVKSYRQIRDFLRERFTLDLKTAIFPIADAGLLLDAGACTTCPRRSGNAPEFHDLATEHERSWPGGPVIKGRPDLCTDPDCFEAKKKAHLKNEAALLEAKGKTVVDGNKARQAVSATGEVKGDYVSAKDARALLKEAGVKPAQVDFITIQDPRSGKVHEAVKREVLASAGVKVQTDRSGSKQRATAAVNHEAQRREREKRAKATTERRWALFRAVRSAAAAQPRSTADLQIVARYLIGEVLDGWGRGKEVAALWGYGSADLLAHALPTMSPDDIGLLLLDVALSDGLESGGYENDPEPELLLEAATAYGIDTTAPTAEPEPAAEVKKDKPAKGIKYRDAATGLTWSGRGLQPVWLKTALAGGRSLTEFAVA